MDGMQPDMLAAQARQVLRAEDDAIAKALQVVGRQMPPCGVRVRRSSDRIVVTVDSAVPAGEVHVRKVWSNAG